MCKCPGTTKQGWQYYNPLFLLPITFSSMFFFPPLLTAPLLSESWEGHGQPLWPPKCFIKTQESLKIFLDLPDALGKPQLGRGANKRGEVTWGAVFWSCPLVAHRPGSPLSRFCLINTFYGEKFGCLTGLNIRSSGLLFFWDVLH